MRYKKYFNGSIPVSEIGLGTWQLGHNSGWQHMSEDQATELVEKSLEFGINFFDTAPNYGLGTGEERLGNALRSADRSKIVINTKFGHTHTGALNFDASYIRESLEGSLRRLKMEYIDSLIIHNPPSTYLDGNKNDHYEILERLIEEGKIKAYGASLDSYHEVKLLLETTNAKVIEVFFNIFHQDTAQGFKMAKAKEVGVIVKIPLDSGWLTGKYNADSKFNDIRCRWSPEDIKTRAYLVNRTKEMIGDEENLAQKAIAFCLAYDSVSTVIPGNVNVGQLESNVKSANVDMSQELVLELEELYKYEIKNLNLPW